MTRRVPQKSVCVPGPSREAHRVPVEVEERELEGRLQHRVGEAPRGARLAEAELRELHDGPRGGEGRIAVPVVGGVWRQLQRGEEVDLGHVGDGEVDPFLARGGARSYRIAWCHAA